MFSTSQLIFGLLFASTFVVLIRLSYKKDKQIHQKHYKGKRYVLIGFIVFVLLLLAAKLWLKQ